LKFGRTCIALVTVLAAVLATAAAQAQSNEIVFAVTEGVTYQATPKEIRDKFDPIAEVLSKALKRPVKLQLVPSYDVLRAGLLRQEYDVAFIHPAHLAFEAIKAGHYKALAWTAGYTDYAVSILGAANAPLKSLRDLKGETLVTPEKDSITWVMVNAMLRAEKLGPDDVRLRITRYQDAVPFYIDNGFANAGATAARSVVKDWTDKGGKVYITSRGCPIKQFIVSTRLSDVDQERMRDALIGLTQTDAGQRALATVGYKGFVAPNPEVQQAMIAWLGI
jgi:ABC-type phosphate/phosphonate transport system substrate-binding protein